MKTKKELIILYGYDQSKPIGKIIFADDFDVFPDRQMIGFAYDAGVKEEDGVVEFAGLVNVPTNEEFKKLMEKKNGR